MADERDPDCLFCRIVAGEIPSDRVYEDDDVVVFRDINPRAPTHVLAIPRRHIADAHALIEADAPLLAAYRSDPDVAQVPEMVTVPAGQTRVTFPVATNAPAWPTVVHLALQRGPLPEFQTFLPVKPPGALQFESVEVIDSKRE